MDPADTAPEEKKIASSQETYFQVMSCPVGLFVIFSSQRYYRQRMTSSRISSLELNLQYLLMKRTVRYIDCV